MSWIFIDLISVNLNADSICNIKKTESVEFWVINACQVIVGMGNNRGKFLQKIEKSEIGQPPKFTK